MFKASCQDHPYSTGIDDETNAFNDPPPIFSTVIVHRIILENNKIRDELRRALLKALEIIIN